MSTNEEKTIIQGLQDNSTRRQAFEWIVRQYNQQLYWQIRRMVFSHDDANDILQNSFIKAWLNIEQFRGDSKLSTWLYRIAYNVFYDYIRSRKEMADLDTREVDAVNCTEQANIGQTMDVYQSLKSLKEVERTCITLFYMEDVSIDKIAGITGIPAGTVKSHLSRGKEKLATYLKQNGYDRNRQ